MPAALDVNWNEVKMLAQQIGPREAARRMGLPEDAVRQRSSRESWMKDIPRSQPLPLSMSQPVTNVTSGPDAQASALKDRLLRTRMNHASVALIASAEMLALAEEEPAKLRDPEVAGVLLTHGKHAALTGGWQQQAPTAKVALQVTGTHLVETGEQQAIDAQWSDSEQVSDGECNA